jgi:hypothetical protein
VLSFPAILIGVFGMAGLLLAVILLAALLPRREEDAGRDALPPLTGRNGDGFTR